MRDEENKKSLKKDEVTKRMKLQRFLRKRWLLPAVYLSSAALILVAAFFMMRPENETELQANDPSSKSENMAFEQEVVPVAGVNEMINKPFHDQAVEVIVPFYSEEATDKEKQAALVYFNNFYYPNNGVSLAKESGESFEVVASLSGTVTEAKKDSTLGYIVTIDHNHGITTHYQSLEELQVEEGMTVKQGDVIGYAGNNLFHKDAGTHLYFELRTDDVAVDPESYFGEPLQLLVKDDDEKEHEDDEKEDTDEQS